MSIREAGNILRHASTPERKLFLSSGSENEREMNPGMTYYRHKALSARVLLPRSGYRPRPDLLCRGSLRHLGTISYSVTFSPQFEILISTRWPLLAYLRRRCSRCHQAFPTEPCHTKLCLCCRYSRNTPPVFGRGERSSE